MNPSLVNLTAAGGLGWLDGFDELLARCGLENNGAPFEIKTSSPTAPRATPPLACTARSPISPPRTWRCMSTPSPRMRSSSRATSRSRGCSVPQIRMETRITTVPGSNSLVVRDEFVNLKEQPVEMQILYHWNFGPPFLDDGAGLSPRSRPSPRATRGAAGSRSTTICTAPPEPGFAEQVYFYELHARLGERSQTLAMLRNHAGDKGVVLRFRNDQLPAFTLWKNTAGLRDGYVTGLEPGTNYPNARPFEQARNRVVRLPVDGRYVTETTLEVLASVRSGRGGRGRDQRHPGAGGRQGQHAAHGAICARGLMCVVARPREPAPIIMPATTRRCEVNGRGGPVVAGARFNRGIRAGGLTFVAGALRSFCTVGTRRFGFGGCAVRFCRLLVFNELLPRPRRAS